MFDRHYYQNSIFEFHCLLKLESNQDSAIKLTIFYA